MPELPEVEIFKRYVDSTSLNQKILNVRVREIRILEKITPEKLVSTLEGNQFLFSVRHGKYLLLKLKSTHFLVLHFGMTGGLKYSEEGNIDIPYSCIDIRFTNGHLLAYTSRRKLGKVTLTQNVGDFLKEKRLGPDAYRITLSDFATVVKNGKGYIKSRLMNQKALAGIGNIYSDEILFQSKIRPQRKTDKLRDGEIKRLFEEMKQVLDTAIECGANPSKFPPYYLIPFRKRGERCPVCGNELKRIKFSNRYSYFCPVCQK